jgi:triosephosphate isomerase
MHWADEGAFTGEVSPLMVREHADYVILGHSERRALFGETDLGVNRKVHAAFGHGLVPVVCVGETEAQRDAGDTDAVVGGQLDAALEGLAVEEAARLVVAYEPVWAIGTGRACAADEAARVTGLIRGRLAAAFGDDVAGRVRVLYGGSVKPANVAGYLAQPDVDGALVGGASLTADAFVPLVEAAAAP